MPDDSIATICHQLHNQGELYGHAGQLEVSGLMLKAAEMLEHIEDGRHEHQMFVLNVMIEAVSGMGDGTVSPYLCDDAHGLGAVSRLAQETKRLRLRITDLELSLKKVKSVSEMALAHTGKPLDIGVWMGEIAKVVREALALGGNQRSG